MIDALLTFDEVLAWDPPVRSLEAQAPMWEPGTAHRYHAWTFGWLVGEAIPADHSAHARAVLAEGGRRAAGVAHVVALPESEMESVARTEMPRDFDSRPVLSELDERAGTINGAIPFPGVGSEMSFNQPAIRRAELARRQRHLDRRSLAKAYAACIDEIDRIRLLSDASIEDALIERSGGRRWGDAPGGDDGPCWGTGFMLASPPGQPMLGPRSFGHSGAGGQLAFADPDRHLAFAYVTNQMGRIRGRPRTETARRPSLVRRATRNQEARHDRCAGLLPAWRSAAAGGAPAVEALVAAAVADHDRAAFGAAGGVGLGGERDLLASEVQRDRLRGAVAIAVRVTVAVGQRAVRGDDLELAVRDLGR